MLHDRQPFPVAGISFRSGLNPESFSLYDPVTFVPEPDNQYDPHAVMLIHASAGEQIGYMPKDLAQNYDPSVDPELGFLSSVFIPEDEDKNFGLRVEPFPRGVQVPSRFMFWMWDNFGYNARQAQPIQDILVENNVSPDAVVDLIEPYNIIRYAEMKDLFGSLVDSHYERDGKTLVIEPGDLDAFMVRFLQQAFQKALPIPTVLIAGDDYTVVPDHTDDSHEEDSAPEDLGEGFETQAPF